MVKKLKGARHKSLKHTFAIMEYKCTDIYMSQSIRLCCISSVTLRAPSASDSLIGASISKGLARRIAGGSWGGKKEREKKQLDWCTLEEEVWKLDVEWSWLTMCTPCLMLHFTTHSLLARAQRRQLVKDTAVSLSTWSSLFLISNCTSFHYIWAILYIHSSTYCHFSTHTYSRHFSRHTSSLTLTICRSLLPVSFYSCLYWYHSHFSLKFLLLSQPCVCVYLCAYRWVDEVIQRLEPEEVQHCLLLTTWRGKEILKVIASR